MGSTLAQTDASYTYTANGLRQTQKDAEGNQTSQRKRNGQTVNLAYDNLNRLLSRTYPITADNTSFSYDLLGRKTAANKTGSANSLAYDGAEYYSAGALLRRYVHGPGVDQPLVWYEGAVTTAKTWLYSDHQGSIVATANSAGTSTATLSYGPYGEPNATTGVRFRYTGQQLLGPLNLYYYKARMYSPAIGRFLQCRGAILRASIGLTVLRRMLAFKLSAALTLRPYTVAAVFIDVC